MIQKPIENLDVYKLAFDVAMRIFELTKSFPIEETFLTDGSDSPIIARSLCEPV